MREWNRKYTWLGPSSDGMLREEGRTVPENVQGMLPSVTFACYPPEQLRLLQWGMKPTVLDQRNPSDLHILALLP
jgi:hypothetical protein